MALFIRFWHYNAILAGFIEFHDPERDLGKMKNGKVEGCVFTKGTTHMAGNHRMLADSVFLEPAGILLTVPAPKISYIYPGERR